MKRRRQLRLMYLILIHFPSFGPSHNNLISFGLNDKQECEYYQAKISHKCAVCHVCWPWKIPENTKENKYGCVYKKIVTF